jgi:hypothetical protein
MVTSPDQAAPGELERLRALLNTWWIPNDARLPRDELAEWLDAHDASQQQEPIERLRSELRDVLEHPGAMDATLTGWIDRYGIRPLVRDRQLEHEAASDTLVAELAVVAVRAVADGSIERLKACPDCRWVFFDHTRNNSKRWCTMVSASPGGRSCGNIAKARRYRQRHASS